MTKQTTPASRLFHALLRFQLRQRLVGLEFGIPAERITEEVGDTEQSILFILDADPDRNVAQLAKLLGLERSWVSRMAAALEEKGLVASHVPDYDKRSKTLKLTERGTETLRHIELKFQGVFEKILSELTKKDEQELRQFLKRLGDGLGAPDYQSHSSGHPLAYQLGRISAATGVYGKEVLGVGLSITQLQVLRIIQSGGDSGMLIGDVNRVVPYDFSTVSRLINDFDEKGYVQKTSLPEDKRAVLVRITAKGKNEWQRCETRIAEVLSAGLRELTQTEIRTGLEILEQLAPSDAPNRDLANLEIKKTHDMKGAKALFSELCSHPHAEIHVAEGEAGSFILVTRGLSREQCVELLRKQA